MKLKVLSYTIDEDRFNTKDDYVVAINPELKRKMNIGKFCVLVNIVTFKNNDFQLKVHCRVVLKNEIEIDSCRVDQTLASAIGIPFKFDNNSTYIDIFKFKLTIYQKITRVLSRLHGVRYLFLRVSKSEVADLEKRLARIPTDTFLLLGTQIGKTIVIEAPTYDTEKKLYYLKTNSVKAFELYESMIKKRDKLLEGSLESRYINAEDVLGVKPDISQIWIDAEGYRKVNAKILDCVKVRRGFRDLYIDEIKTTGIISFLTLFTILAILPVDIKTWFSIFTNSFIIFLVTLTLIFINIRTKLK